jgi:hypothetical protein
MQESMDEKTMKEKFVKKALNPEFMNFVKKSVLWYSLSGNLQKRYKISG